jgi:hypothetical protein
VERRGLFDVEVAGMGTELYTNKGRRRESKCYGAGDEHRLGRRLRAVSGENPHHDLLHRGS